MDELGQILREARESKGLTLAEVQEEIRISPKFLEALEGGAYDLLPTPVHVRGYLRNYARFLKLDPQPLLDRYDFQAGQRPRRSLDQSRDAKPETILPSRDDQPFFDPVNMDVEDGRGQNTESILRLVIIIALIASLILVANRFIPLLTSNRDGTEALTEGIAQVIEDLNDGDGSTADAEGASGVTTGEVITSTSRNDFSEELPTPVPTRPALPATMETIPLKLEITERTWMEVTIDGDVVFSGIARSGDPPYEWEALEEAKVVTGNAIGIFVTIGDIPLGRLGARGENKEEIWRTTGN